MTVYLDASALVKRYVAELGSQAASELTDRAETVATSLISRAEVAAGFARAVRLGRISAEIGQKAQRSFVSEWPDITKIPVTEALVSRAETLAWEYALRGYDAVHLASSLTWQESVGMAVTLATFDFQLWEAGQKARMLVWPLKLAR